MSTDKNIFKARSTKGYYGIMKGVVTRNILHKPKPDLQDWMTSYLSDFFPELAEKFESSTPLGELKKSLLDGVSENKWDVQVWIPAYHGGLNPNPKMIGTKYDVGEYPWAQVCGPIFKDNIGYDNLDNEDKDYIKERFGLKDGDESYPEVWSTLFVGHPFMEAVPSTYPGIGDTVFLAFEGGDINRPIVIGSLACDANKVIYSHSALNSGSISFDNAGEMIMETEALNAADIVTLNADTGVVYPLPNGTPIGTGFGWTYSKGGFHNGVDMPAPHGSAVVAAHAGVASSGDQPSGFGTFITVSGTISGVGISTIYGHLSQILKTGPVEAGDLIAYSGNTGNCIPKPKPDEPGKPHDTSGSHLHFSLKVNGAELTYTCITDDRYYPSDGRSYVSYVDPTGFLTDGNLVVPKTNGNIALPDKRKR